MVSGPLVVVAGLGVAGAIVASGLAGLPGLRLLALERGPRDVGEAGTGLNLGPNAVRTLAAWRPALAERLAAASLPWRRWTVALSDGTALMDLPLRDVADRDGWRIGWAALYRLLRQELGGEAHFGAELTGCIARRDGIEVAWRDALGEHLSAADLLIAADGRYSAVRRALGAEAAPRFAGAALWRMLVEAPPGCPVDDYGQWFNGPNRLLAFRVPGERIYAAGSFPLAPEAPLTEDMKAPERLAPLYLPAGRPAPEVAFLVAAMRRAELHWARLQEGGTRFSAGDTPALLLGDAAHPMLPTLGQGATQAVEDAVVAVAEIRAALAAGRKLATVPAAVSARRLTRVRFAADLSRQATDTMLAGADPVAGTAWKNGPEFRAALARLYRDTPEPPAG